MEASRPSKTGSTEGHVLILEPSPSRTGSPMMLLHLLQWLKTHTTIPFRVVLYQDGPLASEFAALAPTVILTEIGVGRSKLVRRIGKLSGLGPLLKRVWYRFVTSKTLETRPRLVYANSVASASLLPHLVPPRVPLVVHVHELQWAIEQAAGVSGMAAIQTLASRYIVSSASVRENLIRTYGIDLSKIDYLPCFVPLPFKSAAQRLSCRREMRNELGIPEGELVVAGCGQTSWRKGTDLFVEMATGLGRCLEGVDVQYVWVGNVCNDDFTRDLMHRLDEAGLRDRFHFTGVRQVPADIFCGCEVFVLSSREEPMGLVGLEAASVECPIVCFAAAEDMADFVGTACGEVVSEMTADSLAASVRRVLTSPGRQDFGRRAGAKVRAEHSAEVIAPQIVPILERALRVGSCA